MGPEHRGQERLRELMHKSGWHTEKLHGNAFQSGLPDLICWHPTRGVRLVEVKTPSGAFTPAQRHKFHLISAHGGMIWVLVVTDPPDNDHLLSQIKLLDRPANWALFLPTM